MTCSALMGLAIGHGSQKDIVTHVFKQNYVDPIKKDAIIEKGFKNLSQHIGDPAKEGEKLPMVQLYFLWSVERVAMLYGKKTIGEKDWYHWASDVLVGNQYPQGSWEGGFGETVDTCFALLVLRRANLAEDLTRNLRLENPEVHQEPVPQYNPKD